jgi:hypothetical protein
VSPFVKGAGCVGEMGNLRLSPALLKVQVFCGVTCETSG